MTDNHQLMPTYSATVVATLLIFFTWAVVSALASQADLTVPKYLITRSEIGEFMVFFFGPIIHQKLDYVLGNTLILLLIGPLVEQRIGQSRYIQFSLFAGYLITILMYSVGSPTVGYSGITHSLTGHEFASRLIRYDTVFTEQYFRTVIVILTLAYQVMTLSGEGSATAHILGILIGLTFAICMDTGVLERDWLKNPLRE